MNGTDDFELAAALLSLLGEPVPHDPRRDAEAVLIREKLPDNRSALLKAAELCGGRQTPDRLYLRTKIFSWLGRRYDAETAKCAEAYLASPGWDALPQGTADERGVRVDLGAQSRAGVFSDLGGAYAGLGDFAKACAAYAKAYELEPYRIGYAVELSNALVLYGRGGEALEFLRRQKKSPYFRTVKYRGVTGGLCRDSSFRDALELQLAALEQRLENRGEKAGRSS